MSYKVLGALVALPVVLPVMPEGVWSGNAVIHEINYDLTETVGWPQLTATVARVVSRLPLSQRKQASVFTANYGEAGALIVLGSDRGLPPVLSGHNAFWLWGPGNAPDQTVIAVNSVDALRPHFGLCTRAATFHAPDHIVNDESGAQIWVCTGPKGPWRSFWAQLRHYN